MSSAGTAKCDDLAAVDRGPAFQPQTERLLQCDGRGGQREADLVLPGRHAAAAELEPAAAASLQRQGDLAGKAVLPQGIHGQRNRGRACER